MTITKLDPELWLETLTRGLKDYAEAGLKAVVLDDLQNQVGDQVYEVVMEFPSTELITRFVPLPKSLVHFEIDDTEDRQLGFGEHIFRENYDPVGKQNFPQEGREHRVNFDVGIWTSDRSGGTTSRLRAYQVLTNLFSGALAYEALKAATTKLDSGGNFEGAIEILGFTGGRFLTEQVNDVNVYRVMDCTLTVRCYSRTPITITRGTIEDFTQDPHLTVGENEPL